MAQPIRMCIACRQRREKKDLLRIIRNFKGQIEFDPHQKKSGRGVYICPTETCLLKIRTHDLIARHFDVKISPNLYSSLLEVVSPKGMDQFEKLLGFAARSRKLLFGEDAITHSTKKNKLALVVLDPHCGPSTRKRIETFAERERIPLIPFEGEKSLDIIVGKANCRCVGITDLQFAKSILKSIHYPC